MTTVTPSSDRALAHWAETYWTESRQPLTSLVFIAPLLLTYEAGLLLLGENAAQNGADAWLRELLRAVGFGQYFLLPVLTVCTLLAWHHLTGQPWRVRGRVLYAMAAECLLLAFCLRMISPLLGTLLQLDEAGGGLESALAGVTLSIADRAADAVSFLGAGIYEELLFRLILLSLVVWVLKQVKMQRRHGLVSGVVFSSLVFAAAHYVGVYGDPFDPYTFLFRFVAGVFFSVLFVYRGFGIAAGAHAGYDILVGSLMR